MKKIIKQILNGTLLMSMSVILVKILGVIYKVPLSYILTDEGMGYFNTAYTIYGFFYAICSAGIPKAITCIIGEKLTEDRSQAERIYRSSLGIFAALGILVTLIYTLLAAPLSDAIGNSKALYTMLVIGPSIFFVSVGGVARGYMNAHLRLGAIAVSQVIEAVAKLVLGLAFAYIGKYLSFSLEYLSAFSVLGITLGSFFSSLYLYIASKTNKSKENKGQSTNINKSELLVKIIKIALPISAGASVLTLGSVADMAVIMRSLTASGLSVSDANSLYGNYTTLAVPMMNLVTSVLAPLTVALLPRLISYNKRGEMRLFEQDLQKTVSLTALLAAPCSAVYYFYSFELLDILYAAGASAIGAQTLAALSLGVYFLSLLTVINTAHESIGNLKLPLISLSVSLVIKVVLGILLISRPDFGILGAPLGTVVSYFAAFLISAISIMSRGIKINFADVVLPVVLSFFSYGFVYKAIYSVGSLSGSTFEVALQIAVATVAYFVMYFIFFYLSRGVKKVKINKKADI